MTQCLYRLETGHTGVIRYTAAVRLVVYPIYALDRKICNADCHLLILAPAQAFDFRNSQGKQKRGR